MIDVFGFDAALAALASTVLLVAIVFGLSRRSQNNDRRPRPPLGQTG